MPEPYCYEFECYRRGDYACATCGASLCSEHAHVLDNDNVCCGDCLAAAGAVE